MNGISEEIIRGCVANEEKSRKFIYELYYKKMYAICLRYASDSHEAKDMLHDGFLKMFDKVKQVDSVNNFEGWIRRLFTNHCIDYLRSAYKKYISYEPDFNENFTDEDDSDEESGNVISADQYDIKELMIALNQLRPDYRIIINMYAIERFTHQQIAEKLGISHSTSRSKLLRARKSLKKALLKDKK